MVKLRLKRAGRKKHPIYKIVAADQRSPRDGRFIEQVGYYDPNQNPMQITLQEDRVMYWLKTGAQPTDTVRSLFKREGILYKWNLEKRGKSEDEIQSELDKFKERNADKHVRETEKKIKRKETKAKQEAEAKKQAEAPKEEPAKEEAEVKAEETAVAEPEVKEEVKEEAPEVKEEVKEETPEVKEEVKEETPEIKDEAKEEPKEEVKEEESKEEEPKE
ncbi:MAG: 30S ribosomal protein S16 [Ignavibacteriae bacterium]|nr:30S ribosomal protein S16 [Ignavibacteriota bacterium]MCB9243406.1 30S ribosomal protein S16 [Ignavibacteriales bacterium]